MWVLWAYCPRRMVARAGQHKGKVEVMLVNSTPLLMMLFFRAGIKFSVPGNWSSVRTKIMLGSSAAAAIDLAEPITTASTTTLARSTAVTIEATSRIALPIRPYLVRRRSAKAHASSRDELILTQVV